MDIPLPLTVISTAQPPHWALTSVLPPTAQNIAAAAQTSWCIDPVNGSDDGNGSMSSPLKTALRMTYLIGPALVMQPVTVDLMGPASAGDLIIPPPIGPGGYISYDGADGLSTIHSGTLSGAVAQSGNSAATVTDSAFSSWVVGKRVRRTSDNAISWVAATSSHVATIGDAQVMNTGPFPDFGPNRVTFQNGDAYVLETAPSWPIMFANPILADINGDNNYSKLGFYSITLSSSGNGLWAAPPAVGLSDVINFYGCCVSGMSLGVCTTYACQWDQAYLPDTGSAQYHSGGVFIWSGANIIFPGADIGFADGSILVGGSLIVNGSAITYGDGLGILSSSGDGLDVAEGGVVAVGSQADGSSGALWGSGNAGFGCRVDAGGTLIWTTIPTITGTSGNARIGGATKDWSSITAGYAGAGANAWPQVT